METFDEQSAFTGAAMNGIETFRNTALDVSGAIPPPPPDSGDGTAPASQPQVNDAPQRNDDDLVLSVLPGASLTEKFLLTAADPAPGSRDERLNRVIRTKLEAGFLKPYNFVKGYSRLSRWMDCKYVCDVLPKSAC
jgi:hypothetical protein